MTPGARSFDSEHSNSHLPPQVPESELAAPHVHLANCDFTRETYAAVRGEVRAENPNASRSNTNTPRDEAGTLFFAGVKRNTHLRLRGFVYYQYYLARAAQDCRTKHALSALRSTKAMMMRCLTVQSHCWRDLGWWYSLNFLEYPFHLLQQCLPVWTG